MAEGGAYPLKVRFLLDQNLSLQIAIALWRHDAAIDVLAIGQAGAPPLGTLDPEILLYCEADQRALVTENRSTMPIHEAAHFAAGRHHAGIFQLRRQLGIGDIADALYLIWAASEAEEWIDQTVWTPF
jgi:hypothetical protein